MRLEAGETVTKAQAVLAENPRDTPLVRAEQGAEDALLREAEADF